MSEPASIVSAMDVQHDVGPRPDQVLVAAFQGRPAEVLSGQMPLLEHGPHRPIEDENAGLERVE